MTEEEWLTCTDPEPMWQHTVGRGTRKPRLCQAVCCRRIWHLLRDERSRRAVEVLEQYADRIGKMAQALKRATRAAEVREPCADRQVSMADVYAASGDSQAAYMACFNGRVPRRFGDASVAAHWAISFCSYSREPDRTAAAAANAVAYTVKVGRAAARKAERAAQADLLRDIFGNPFRRIKIHPSAVRWHGGSNPKLAAAIYLERRFDDLSILADMLEEAGCADEFILTHCRGPGPHVRGCWVVDLLLGKQ
jgi:hypothetical protein